jgi:uncharacterized membrane protein HdeD (DUF308 family)
MWMGSFRTLMLRGFFTALFGLLLVGWPGTGLAALILVFGAFALIDGALIIIAGWNMWPVGPARAIATVTGVLAMLAGVAMLAWPGATAMVLLWLIAIRAAVIGVAELIIAMHVDRYAPGAWLIASMGVLSILVAALLVANPAGGLLVIVRVFGLYAAVLGLLTIAEAWVTESRYA